MATKAGKSGAFKLSTNTVTEIQEWSLDVDLNLADSASFGDDWEEKTATLRKWSGSAKGNFDIADTNGHAALVTAVTGGTSVSARFYEDGSKYWSGTAFVKANVTANVNGLVEVTYSITGTGALSYN